MTSRKSRLGKHLSNARNFVAVFPGTSCVVGGFGSAVLLSVGGICLVGATSTSKSSSSIIISSGLAFFDGVSGGEIKAGGATAIATTSSSSSSMTISSGLFCKGAIVGASNSSSSMMISSGFPITAPTTS